MDSENLYIIHDYVLLIGIFVIFLLFTTSLYFILSIQRLKKQNQKLQEINTLTEQKLNNVQLEQIGTKLNPHLFKNILNSVQSHAYQTYMSLDKLANVLDYILYESDNKFVRVKDEINFALSLIEINKIKVNPLFDFRLKTNIDKFDIMYEEKILAPLLSVDLIENAFKHTDFLASDAFIFIHLELQNGIFKMRVSNKSSSKLSIIKKNSGFGNQSLDQRLKMIYHNYYELKKSFNNDIYTSQLSINLKAFHDKMRYIR